MTLRDIEKNAILREFARLNGDRELTAESLGIGLRTLYDKLREYGVTARSRVIPPDMQRQLHVGEGPIVVAPQHTLFGWCFRTDNVSPISNKSWSGHKRELLSHTLEACGGCKKTAARILGVSLKTIYNQMKTASLNESLQIL